jgi:TP901-1 family phage major tail protein
MPGSAQRGDQILLKLGDAASPETFTAVAGLRTKSMTINTETVDVTSADDTSKWRQLLEGAGVKNIAISGSGVFKDDTSLQNVNTAALAQSHDHWQVVVPGLGTFEGSFQISSLQYSGEYNGEATYDLSLESAGDIAFTAE